MATNATSRTKAEPNLNTVADDDPWHGDDIGDGTRDRAHDHHRTGRAVDHPLTDRAEEKFLETSLATGPYDNQVGRAAGLDERPRW